MVRREWRVFPRNCQAERHLVESVKITRLVAAVLVRRGITDPADARRFLQSDLANLHDPSLLPDYDKARDILIEAIREKRMIYIHGDYDVDGVTSAAILAKFFECVGANYTVHVPHRMKEGYGVHLSAVERAQECGAEIFLTCDCGVSAVEPLKMVRALGMKTVVTDHHEPGRELPDVDALVNPHVPGSVYPFEMLSGAGVAFKLCAGLTRDLGMNVEQYYRAFLDLAVLGTVADIMPIVDENRVIARHGLVALEQTKKVGLKKLITLARNGQTGALTTSDIGYKLGPRLNAAGRLDDAAHSLRLLLTKDETEATVTAEFLDRINLERRTEQNKAVEEAVAWVEENGLQNQNVLVVFNPDWHAGLVGLIAGKLTETYYRPTFALTRHDTYAKGSARSIPGFNLAQAIQDLSHILLGGGGHEMAAGVTLPLDRIDEFRTAVHEYGGKILSADQLTAYVDVDVEVEPGEANYASVESLEILEPFGSHNERPRFLLRGLTIERINKVGAEGQHLRLQLRDARQNSICAIWFNSDPDVSFHNGDLIDVVGHLECDQFNGARRVQIKVQAACLTTVVASVDAAHN